MAYRVDLVALGRFIRGRRKQLDLTQTALGEQLGWAQERVSALENGRYGMPGLPQLCSLADSLNVPLAELLRHLGIEEAPGPVMDIDVRSERSELRLSHELATMLHQMHAVEDRLHHAEQQMLRAGALRASIAQQRQYMAELLASSRDS